MGAVAVTSNWLERYPKVLQSWQTRPGAAMRWRLGEDGVTTQCGQEAPLLMRSPGAPTTAAKLWGKYGLSIKAWARVYDVPVELVLACIATESGGDRCARRQEPGYVSPELTPARISAGLMQTLLSTARMATNNPNLTLEWLLIPEHSIRAGVAYMASQQRQTAFDPPLVAAAYNAGSLRDDHEPGNPWRLVCYPAHTGAHVTRFISWFNDAVAMLAQGRPQAG